MLRRKLSLLCILTTLVCLCTYAYVIQLEQRAVADRLIRLHVVANSDSAEDQFIKLQIRDEIVPIISSITANCTTRQEAEKELEKNLLALQQAAEQKLNDLHCSQTVRVTLATELFPRRDYDTFSLPAGGYRALRVALGSGAGHNWWCVAFPALCMPATTEEFIEAAQTSGMSSDQTDLLTGQDVTVELKFKFLEWLQELFS